MSKFIGLIIIAILLVQCDTGKKEKKGFSYERTKEEDNTKREEFKAPVDLNNKGVGPVKSVTFTESINSDLAAKGKTLYMEKCTICHLPEKKMIGPALKGVYERRSAEWVMNMIINPLEMLRNDTIAKALQKEYNGAIMMNQNITEIEARAIAEYLRTL